MAQDGTRPAGQHGTEASAAPRQQRVANRVYTAMDEMKPSDREAVLDRVAVEPELRQLGPRDDSVLPPSKCRDLRVRRSRCDLS
jgi:hypothetical protein